MNIDDIYNEVYNDLTKLGLPVTRAELIVSNLNEHTGTCQYYPKDNKYVIKIMKKLVDSNNIKEIKKTLAHELIHTCPGTYKHDKEWQKFIKIAEDNYHYGLFEVYDNDSLFKNDLPVKQEYFCPECNTDYKVRKIIETPNCPWCKKQMKIKRLF